MGKASKWFRGLLGLKKTDPSSSSSKQNNPNPNPTKPTKKKWSFVKSYREKDSSFIKPADNKSNYGVSTDAIGSVDPTKRAIAVAEATAVVAEAAIAAAQAAAAVVKLTSSGRGTAASNSTCGAGAAVMAWNGVAVSSSSASSAAVVNRSRAESGSREDWAAVVIQSHFRAYLVSHYNMIGLTFIQ